MSRQNGDNINNPLTSTLYGPILVDILTKEGGWTQSVRLNKFKKKNIRVESLLVVYPFGDGSRKVGGTSTWDATRREISVLR